MSQIAERPHWLNDSTETIGWFNEVERMGKVKNESYEVGFQVMRCLKLEDGR